MYWQGVLLGALAVAALGLSHRLREVLLLLDQHEQRLEAVERGVEDASAGVDQLTEDLTDLERRAVAVPPEYVRGDEEAPD